MRKSAFCFERPSQLLVVALCVFAAGAAYSATITVNSGESIQAAIESASAGDEIVISAGAYEEDINIGDLNAPGNKKDNLTLKAADGAEVTIKVSNNASRLEMLGALGADFGTADRMGFIIYGDGVTVEGITFEQINVEVNNYDISSMISVLSSDVTFTNCEFSGIGADAAGDAVGLAITPLDALSLSEGVGGLATNLAVTDCTFHDLKYPYGNANFLLALGVPAPSPESTITGCEFYNSGTCINMDDGFATLIDCHFHDNLGTAVDASDDGVVIKNCLIETSGENGVEISNAETEDDDEQGVPHVTIEDCVIINNGTADDHNGINIEHGTLTVKNTVIALSSGVNVFFKTETDRTTTATFDHCDIYNSYLGTGLSTPAEPKDIITLTMTNCIVSDFDCFINDAGPLAEITLDTCNFFAADAQFLPDEEFITMTGITNVDPQYVDADNGDFSLQAGSPMIGAANDGTDMGSQGGGTGVCDWTVY